MRCAGAKLPLNWGRVQPWCAWQLPPVLLVGGPGGAAAAAAFVSVAFLYGAMALPGVCLGWLFLDAYLDSCDATLGLVSEVISNTYIDLEAQYKSLILFYLLE
jgi:hypothetical protein